MSTTANGANIRRSQRTRPARSLRAILHLDARLNIGRVDKASLDDVNRLLDRRDARIQRGVLDAFKSL
jgi:hypothetical protein